MHTALTIPTLMSTSAGLLALTNSAVVSIDAQLSPGHTPLPARPGGYGGHPGGYGGHLGGYGGRPGGYVGSASFSLEKPP